jgi:serine phosphatase RsbU (regulator of sigma subunit)
MAVQSITEAYQTLANIENKSDRERKADFLRPLSTGTVGLFGIALLIMAVSTPRPQWYGFVIVGVGLLFNVGILFLNKRGYTELAAQLFCYAFNLECLVLYVANISLLMSDPSESPDKTILMGMVMTLSILLAGMLISQRVGFWFAAANISLIFIPYLLLGNSLDVSLQSSFPIMAFALLMAIISWLYQRSLSNAHARLNAARQEVMRSELLRRDLTIARDLQQRLYPAPPVNSGALSIASICEPARETSGDFYDFIPLDPGVWAIVVADVTGKSLAAAMVMTMTRSIFRSNSQHAINAAEVIAHTNEILCADSAVKQLTTAFYGILDSQRMTLRFANAGHPYPMLKRKGQVEDLELVGFPLGSWITASYSERMVQLQPGDQVILVSDGIVEAMNAQRELFGFERLAETIARCDAATPQACLDSIWQAVERFEAGAEQQDDKTIVVLQVAAEAAAPALESLPQAVGAFA